MRSPFPALLAALLLAGCATMPAPPTALAPTVKPDITVAVDGTGDFKTVEAAVASIPQNNRQRMIVFVKNGTYHEKVRIDASDVTLLGESRQDTRIEFAQSAAEARTAKDRSLGTAVVNINGDDCVLQNLTVHNTNNVVGIHAFAIYGRGDRTVITDANVWSAGNDTLSLWRTSDGMFSEDATAHTSPNGRYYHARLDVCGSIDFICPRGWCYMVDSQIHELNPNNGASIWQDGNRDKSMKFTLRGCRFDGVPFQLARHHHDAQILLLDCTFSGAMLDRQPKRVLYPLDGGKPTAADVRNNQEHDPTNIWGERFYYYNCHRDGGDFAWFKDNLSAAAGAPNPEQVTAAWTFDGKWDPENTTGPSIGRISTQPGQIAVTFSENVTVKGHPRLVLRSGGFADYAGVSGATVLFTAPTGGTVSSVDLAGGAILATEASANLRFALLGLPAS